jgi:hypothetical protein
MEERTASIKKMERIRELGIMLEVITDRDGYRFRSNLLILNCLN